MNISLSNKTNKTTPFQKGTDYNKINEIHAGKHDGIVWEKYQHEFKDEVKGLNRKPTHNELTVRAGNDKQAMKDNKDNMHNIDPAITNLWEKNTKNNTFPKGNENKWEDRNNYLNTYKPEKGKEYEQKAEVRQQCRYKQGEESIKYNETFLSQKDDKQLQTHKEKSQEKMQQKGGMENLQRAMDYATALNQEKRAEKQEQKQTQQMEHKQDLETPKLNKERLQQTRKMTR